jgi:hypothetical protein
VSPTMRLAVSVSLSGILVSACSTDSGVAPTERAGLSSAVAAAVSAPGACATCVFGPRGYTRSSGTPVAETAIFVADTSVQYVVEITDNGSQGANATVTLNGALLYEGGSLNRSLALRARNALVVRLTGKPGSTLTVSIRATVVPPRPVRSVLVAPQVATLVVGQAMQLSATTMDADGTVLTGRAVTWQSSNPTVATVSSTGIVGSVGVGVATITATSEGVSGTATVNTYSSDLMVVSGLANVFGYGVSTPAPAGGGGGIVAPVLPVTSTEHAWIEIMTTGLASPDGPTMVPPDGFSEGGNTNLLSVAPISGFAGPNAFMLVGVFVPAGEIASLPAPANLTYATLADYERIEYQPGLRQVFFIGDGRTAAGATQRFVVPAGAAKLVLGLADGYSYQGQVGGYYNNAGAFNALVKQFAK